MGRRLLLAVTAVLLAAAAAVGATPDERRAYRDRLVEILPDVPAFAQWLGQSGELPPDFDALPRHNGLPEPLEFFDGRKVASAADWQARRAEILEHYQKYAWGTIPPRPELRSADVQETTAQGTRRRNVALHFGPEGQALLHLTLALPPGEGPFPVLMGPGLIGGFGGGASTSALRRGYAVASYSASDGRDDSIALAALYPDCDPGALPRRAWAATLVLDYLQDVPEVDMRRVAIYGYSRDGKQVAIAGALDERIAAVVAGSTGVGGVLPYRLAGERNHAEGIESTTKMFPDWFHPRLRYFAGREDRLPVDGNLLLALLAPRACLMISGYNDEVANTYGDEQSWHSAMKVYEMLGAPDRLGLLRVPGYHGANDMEAAFDFLDIQFGKSEKIWTNQFVFSWDWDKWRNRSGETVDSGGYPDRRNSDLLAGADGPIASTAQWETRAAETRHSIAWMLGEKTPAAESGAANTDTAERFAANAPELAPPDVVAWVIRRGVGGSQEFGWPRAENSQTASRKLDFGDGVHGDLYFPAATPEGATLPVVVWLHGYSYPLGYMWVYHRDLHPILALVKAGYAVLAYDQAGFGSRMGEAAAFYDRYPHWSQMGRMVEDVRAAVDALRNDALIDGDRVYLFGYSLGGTVALHAAALDPDVAGVVSICGFTPMRTDVAEQGTGGVVRLGVERGLMPRLGFFVGQEARIPYDYDALIAAIAPRPVYVLAPQLDRDATAADVRAAVERAGKVYALYAAAEKLHLDEPWDYNRLPTNTQDRIIAWMKENMP